MLFCDFRQPERFPEMCLFVVVLLATPINSEWPIYSTFIKVPINHCNCNISTHSSFWHISWPSPVVVHLVWQLNTADIISNYRKLAPHRATCHPPNSHPHRLSSAKDNRVTCGQFSLLLEFLSEWKSSNGLKVAPRAPSLSFHPLGHSTRRERSRRTSKSHCESISNFPSSNYFFPEVES